MTHVARRIQIRVVVTLASIALGLLVAASSAAADGYPGYVPAPDNWQAPAGVSAKTFATGFDTSQYFGLGGIAPGPDGKMYVANPNDGYIYRFGSEGGTANAAHRLPYHWPSHGPGYPLRNIAFDRNGDLYVVRWEENLGWKGGIWQVDRDTGAPIRKVAVPFVCGPVSISFDPLSGDMFVAQSTCSLDVLRISGYRGANPQVSTYVTAALLTQPWVQQGWVNALHFDRNGTLYMGAGVWPAKVTGTNVPGPPQVQYLGQTPYLYDTIVSQERAADGDARYVYGPARNVIERFDRGRGYNPAEYGSAGASFANTSVGAGYVGYDRSWLSGSGQDLGWFSAGGLDHCMYTARYDSIVKFSQNGADACGGFEQTSFFDDPDGDDVLGVYDNCPDVANPDQADSDRDGKGDACEEPDDDVDGNPNGRDNCPNVPNPDQTDTDGDGKGDACDKPTLTGTVFFDPDEDGVITIWWNEPGLPGAELELLDADGNVIDTTTSDWLGSYAFDLPDDPAGDYTIRVVAANFDREGALFDWNPTRNGNVQSVTVEDTNLSVDFGYVKRGRDPDDDGQPDGSDNCAAVHNPDQEDSDGDGIGDACEDDHDGEPGPTDNCPFVANDDQADRDGDHKGDACDPLILGDEVWGDANGDGERDAGELGIPNVKVELIGPDGSSLGERTTDQSGGYSFALSDPQTGDYTVEVISANFDAGGPLHAAEATTPSPKQTRAVSNQDVLTFDFGYRQDGDGDGEPNSSDNCPDVANPGQADADRDGIGDACDPDRDGDGEPNDSDNCADVVNAGQADADRDGIGDACDPDLDGDGVPNGADSCRSMPNPDQSDSDRDGIGDACDADRDGDGRGNDQDNCPDAPNSAQADSDQDGVGDACETNLRGRMTGGGSISGTSVTHGFELSCNAASLPETLQVNWGRANTFHLTRLTSALCGDNPNISGLPRDASFDTYTGTGGGIYNGKAGATASWTFTDAGEPGTKDDVRIVIKDAAGDVVLGVGGKLAKGNHQAHHER